MAKKLTLYGRWVRASKLRSSLSKVCAVSIAAGNEPSAPASQTAAANAAPCTPAMGAWTSGSRTPGNKVFSNVPPVQLRG